MSSSPYTSEEIASSFREKHFSRLVDKHAVYLDAAGAALYSEQLLKDITTELSQELLANPHSQSPSSLAATDRVNQARKDILAFFNTDPLKYSVIFTSVRMTHELLHFLAYANIDKCNESQSSTTTRFHVCPY